MPLILVPINRNYGSATCSHSFYWDYKRITSYLPFLSAPKPFHKPHPALLQIHGLFHCFFSLFTLIPITPCFSFSFSLWFGEKLTSNLLCVWVRLASRSCASYLSLQLRCRYCRFAPTCLVTHSSFRTLNFVTYTVGYKVNSEHMRYKLVWFILALKTGIGHYLWCFDADYINHLYLVMGKM